MHNPARRALDYSGALYGEGRWNSRGVPVIYTAQHISLAALEILVHGGGKKIPPKMVTSLSIPEEVAFAGEEQEWLDFPYSQRFGDRWVQEARTMLLKVPSAVADKMESNFILNPFHADFVRIVEGQARPFQFDARFTHLP